MSIHFNDHILTHSYSVSFTNCSRVYNVALDAHAQNLRSGIIPMDKTPQLDPDHVQDAFIIHTLLLDAIRRGSEIGQDDPITAQMIEG